VVAATFKSWMIIMVDVVNVGFVVVITMNILHEHQ